MPLDDHTPVQLDPRLENVTTDDIDGENYFGCEQHPGDVSLSAVCGRGGGPEPYPGDPNRWQPGHGPNSDHNA